MESEENFLIGDRPLAVESGPGQQMIGVLGFLLDRPSDLYMGVVTWTGAISCVAFIIKH